MTEGAIERTSETSSLADLEAALGYRFKDSSLLLNAITHRSFVNEHEGEGLQHNESMEFLGDAVLGFLVSSRIYLHSPASSEGELSKKKAFFVSAANLVQLAEKIELGKYLRLSRGEDKTGGRKKRAILADGYEAILGAIYLDGGVEAAAGFIDRQMGGLLRTTDRRRRTYGDFKSALQEKLHNLGRPAPVYRVVREIGPDHRKTFVVQILQNDEVVAEASGKTKKEAQQAAARIVLESLKDEAAMAAAEAPKPETSSEADIQPPA